MSSSSVDKTRVLFIIVHSFLAITLAWATEIPYQLTLSLHRPPPPPRSTPMDQSPEILPKLRLGWPTGSHIIYMWTQALKNKTAGRPRSASLADRRSASLGAGVGCWLPGPQALKAFPVMLGGSTQDSRNKEPWGVEKLLRGGPILLGAWWIRGIRGISKFSIQESLSINKGCFRCRDAKEIMPKKSPYVTEFCDSAANLQVDRGCK